MYSKFWHIGALILSLAFFSACEEVIELDLDDGGPMLNIEGVVADQTGPYLVKISRSVGFYEDNEFPPVSGALVTISDNEGHKETLEEISPGIYQTNTLRGKRGNSYDLEVELEGKSYQASSQIPPERIPIKNLEYGYRKGSFFSDDGYYVTAFFEDPEGLGNYYRLVLLVNGEEYFFEVDGDMVRDNNLWLSDDKYTDGNIQDFEFPHTLEEGDTVDVALYHLDQTTYDYYRTLEEVIDGGGVAPSNPLSNFGDEALGYFGAYSVTSLRVIIIDPEKEEE
ncbi:DUF4249 domain-containing protein [Echinicola jeungdonensis]|uniref:DUF4249 domain-containing protein n=1 Tax=Echinicola jeungdonensis TaxID=709343 RepID=A0ABV5J8Q2_9BACT|nr:DUF4249 domain-containing protein [Echinicola jeungdonensis]MDN3670284.1 DUF4249 domain-containing protein [Echinicola jeungdonensis]